MSHVPKLDNIKEINKLFNMANSSRLSWDDKNEDKGLHDGRPSLAIVLLLSNKYINFKYKGISVSIYLITAIYQGPGIVQYIL